MSQKDLPKTVQQDLIQEFKQNPDVFHQVYEFYYDMILGYLSSRCGSAQVGYDITAESFIKAYQNFHKFKWTGVSIKSWLFRIASNELKQHWRKAKPFLMGDDILSHKSLIADAREELQALDRDHFESDEARALRKGMEKLNKKYQMVISLYYFSELSLDELADTLDKSKGATKVLVHRAVQQLKQHLDPSILTS